MPLLTVKSPDTALDITAVAMVAEVTRKLVIVPEVEKSSVEDIKPKTSSKSVEGVN